MKRQARLEEILSLQNIIGISPEMQLFRHTSQYKHGDRIFYELGAINGSGSWTREGQFMEVKNPENFIFNGDHRWNNIEWMNHHNCDDHKDLQ